MSSGLSFFTSCSCLSFSLLSVSIFPRDLFSPPLLSLFPPPFTRMLIGFRCIFNVQPPKSHSTCHHVCVCVCVCVWTVRLSLHVAVCVLAGKCPVYKCVCVLAFVLLSEHASKCDVWMCVCASECVFLCVILWQEVNLYSSFLASVHTPSGRLNGKQRESSSRKSGRRVCCCWKFAVNSFLMVAPLHQMKLLPANWVKLGAWVRVQTILKRDQEKTIIRSEVTVQHFRKYNNLLYVSE